MPRAWHYIAENWCELRAYDLRQAGVAYLKVVQSRREELAARPPAAFSLEYMRGNRHRLNFCAHNVCQYSNKNNQKRMKTWHYILEPSAYRLQLY